MSTGCLSGLRILIAEDEYMLAMELSEAVRAEGGEVVALAPSAEDAERWAGGPLDGAILDIQLRDRTSYALARRLRSRGIPFVFTTGYESAALPDDLRDAPRLAKPVSPADLVRMAAAAFVRAPDRPGG